MIVVDTTVLGDLLFGEAARRASSVQLQAVDPEWLCIGLALYEIGNVAWKQVRHGGLSASDAETALQGVKALLTEVEHDFDSTQILQISVNREISFYDASHVWLAQKRGFSMYSRDKKLLNVCSDIVRPMPQV